MQVRTNCKIIIRPTFNIWKKDQNKSCMQTQYILVRIKKSNRPMKHVSTSGVYESFTLVPQLVNDLVRKATAFTLIE